MARVTPSVENINDASKYEFFAGHDSQGEPIWTGDFAKIRPLAGLEQQHGLRDGHLRRAAEEVFDVRDRRLADLREDAAPTSSRPIGSPVRGGMVVYMKDFGEQGYFLNFPSKFIGRDGKRMWLCYSTNFAPSWNGMKLKVNPPGGRYGLCLQEVQFLAPGDKAEPAAQ